MELPDATRNAILEVFDAVNGGTLRFHTAAHGQIASLALAATAFGAPSSGTITAATITSDTNTSAGTIDHADLYTSGGTLYATLSVGTSGTEIILSGLTFSSGDTLSMSSLTITMPAS
jgi:hypothetical protein